MAEKLPSQIEQNLEAIAIAISKDVLDPNKVTDTRTKLEALKVITGYLATIRKVAPSTPEGDAFNAYSASLDADSGGSDRGGTEAELSFDLDEPGAGGNVVKLKADS